MASTPFRRERSAWTLLYILLAVGYAGYLGVVISAPYGPVDFETFREIGARFIRGETPYGVNSYYPMPYVGIFGLLALLPRPLAVLLWLGLPVALAVALFGPWSLAFAPLFAHFSGGQTAVFGMLAVWAARRSPLSGWTGLVLALATFKPQLAVVPVLWAAWRWWGEVRAWRRLPRAAWVFALSVLGMWLPWFALRPGWVSEWLANPRGLSERAMAGLAPRLLHLAGLPAVWFWLALAACAALLIWVARRGFNVDHAVLLWAILSPLVHDYDLIQMLPLADTGRMRLAAVLASLPTWLVILFAYRTDTAWLAVTLIAPVMLAMALIQRSRAAALREEALLKRLESL